MYNQIESKLSLKMKEKYYLYMLRYILCYVIHIILSIYIKYMNI